MGKTLIKVLLFSLLAVLLEIAEMYLSRYHGRSGFRIKVVPNLLD